MSNGTHLIKKLSKELGDEFGKGFSIANLKNFRKFYLTYPEKEKGYALRTLLSWTHHRLIMRVEDRDSRMYYLTECSKQNWSTRALERQFRISTETSYFYIDLGFYNYLLKCFVVIDLKTEKLSHQDIGQMDMYVRMFDDNPIIGIILCTDKDETILPTEEELVRELERETARLEDLRTRGKL